MRLRPIIGPSDRTFGVCTKVWGERKKENQSNSILLNRPSLSLQLIQFTPVPVVRLPSPHSPYLNLVSFTYHRSSQIERKREFIKMSGAAASAGASKFSSFMNHPAGAYDTASYVCYMTRF